MKWPPLVFALSLLLLVLSVVHVGGGDPSEVTITPPDPVERSISTERGVRQGAVTWQVDLPPAGGTHDLLTSRISYHEIAFMRGGYTELRHLLAWTVDGQEWYRMQHTSMFEFGDDDEGGLEVSRQEVRKWFGPADSDRSIVYRSEVPTTATVTWEWTLFLRDSKSDVDIEIEFGQLIIEGAGSRACASIGCGLFLVIVTGSATVGSAFWWRRTQRSGGGLEQ